ncbi:hypothetical protein ACQY0O_005525 [Thecaphora frezii]
MPLPSKSSPPTQSQTRKTEPGSKTTSTATCTSKSTSLPQNAPNQLKNSNSSPPQKFILADGPQMVDLVHLLEMRFHLSDAHGVWTDLLVVALHHPPKIHANKLSNKLEALYETIRHRPSNQAWLFDIDDSKCSFFFDLYSYRFWCQVSTISDDFLTYTVGGHLDASTSLHKPKLLYMGEIKVRKEAVEEAFRKQKTIVID